MNTEHIEKFVNAIACDLEEGGFRQVSGTTLRRSLTEAVSAALPLLQPAELTEQQGDALLPCPFCGNAAEFVSYKSDGLTLKCTSLGCIQRNQRSLRYGIDSLRDSMTKHWNSRVLAARQPVEMSPDFTDSARGAIAWVLWHHQGGSSPVGQPLRFALGMGQHDRMTDQQIAEAKRFAAWAGATTESFHRRSPAQGIDLGQDKFRDTDHLAEWLGSLVDGNEQEEWDAAQAAMQGVRAYQGDADTILRLQAAVEGECDGLAITPEQAVAILDYVLQPLNYDDGQRDAAKGVVNG